MNNDWKKTREIHWKDELNDDFDKVGLSRPSVPENYNYIRKGFVYNIFANCLYYGVAIPILGLYCIFHGIRIKNKKNLKEIRKTGGFIYSNHVALSDVVKFQTRVMTSKRVNIIGYSDSLSMPVVKHICKMLGYIALPLKGDTNNFLKMCKAINYYTKEKHQFVLIFPEAHIWPYYTGIRTFKPGSFMYPANSNMPLIPVVTTWRKSKFGKKPKQTLIVGTTIYPRTDLSSVDNKDYLYNECLKQMKEISNSVTQYEYIRYIKDN